MRHEALLLALAALLAVAGPVCAQVAPPSAATNLWFPVGEELEYSIHWGVFHVGTSVVKTEWTEHEGRTLLAIRYRTRSNKVIAAVYPVDDTLEALIDPETFLPVRFRKTLNEGTYHRDEETVFDHAAGVARYRNLKKDERREVAIKSDTRDLIAGMYYMRREPFVPGERRAMELLVDGKIYELLLDAKKRERFTLDRYGERASVKVSPTAAFEGIFVRKGKMTVWVSDDERRVCTRIQASVPVADVRINLKRVRGPGDDYWVR